MSWLAGGLLVLALAARAAQLELAALRAQLERLAVRLERDLAQLPDRIISRRTEGWR